ncbi:hypothetical protein HXX76_006660 [Chlamydomonas incerta]|uniref:HTH La-type RNA-binding domain-containing protein n=1 Tax=Chlamydomonas incerta TaxID=51695 RepID=A0A835T5A0_CHLIN|nr:hypothetical protein HXX76_006660 [Chlamydomonas incerta]|eukprot:KAG2436353.1 hypothetical protein HXX76_006660 [Chlamydomonas incerta]
MAEHKATSAAGSDAEVFLSASEDEAVQQEVTPELLSALVKQVEFYFSDANLPTDKKLLKQIRKDAEGYVPVKLFANFRKVRALSKDVAIITEALRNAKLLQLSEDGKRVKRLVTVPDYDIDDIQRRTIVVENLPAVPSPTIESVTDMFRMYGRVKLVRICSRESKGKLPSWLTSSCQNMQGQHAYVEFEDEEGAVLSAAALAQEYDAPDGAVQVRRLLACIAEHRERRSGAGASSFGGSSVQGGMSGSRKGSRDVSPNRPGAAGSRRNSHGGMSSGGATMTSYGGAYSSRGGASSHHGWASMGGAAPSDFGHAHLHVQHHHHSYGGAYEHFGGSRRGSGGGAPSCGGGVPPPPPPPPRRSCDSAPASELLHSALVAPPPPPPPPQAPAAPLPVPALAAAAPAPAQPPRLNIYRPPAKRLSDGVSGMPASAASPLIRSSGGSFTSGSSHCSATSSVAASAVSTPTVASQLASPMMASVAMSPPLASRPLAVSAGGKPPVPHTAAPAPSHAAKPELAAAVPSSALAEAIAAAAAERRASEAGVAKAPEAAAAPRAPISVAAAPSAPKFMLDLPAAGNGNAASARRNSPPGTASGEAAVVSPSGAPMAPKVLRAAAPAAPAGAMPVAAAAAPAARATQMVADVEGFINNILASSIPAPRANGAGAAAAAGAKPVARKQPAPKQLMSSAQPQDAAAAVAGILASALRSKASTAAPAATAAAPAAAAPAGPMIFLTAVMEGEDIAVADLEHAVTVSVHMPAAAAPKSAAGTPAKGAPTAAVPKYSPSAAQRSSVGGLVAGSASPVLATAASISDGGVAGSGHATPASAMMHVARGPDGSRGFGRRGPMVA